MVNASQWLEINYPRNGACLIFSENLGKRRSEVKFLSIIYKELNGTLDLSDFTNLEHLTCFGNQISQIILPNRCKLERLDCSHNQLTILDLASCFQLKWIYCNHNQLTKLNLPNDNLLVFIIANDNYLKSFDFSKLNPDNLYYLNIINNNFESTNISVFRHLKKLNSLIIGNDYFFQKSNFYGSFEALKKCTKLKEIWVCNTKVDHGLEFLPESIKYIYLNGLLEKILDKYKGNNLVEKLKSWKKDNPELVKNAEMIAELAEYEENGNLIKEVFSTVKVDSLWWKDSKNQLTFQMLCNENYPFRRDWLDGKYIIIENLRTKNKAYYQNIEKNERSERNKKNIQLVSFSFFFIAIIIIFISNILIDIWENRWEDKNL